MQWPGITPARLNNAVAPQEGSRPFGPQGTPSDDFLPRCACPGLSAVCVSMAATPHCIGGRPADNDIGTDDSRRPPMQARYVSHSAVSTGCS